MISLPIVARRLVSTRLVMEIPVRFGASVPYAWSEIIVGMISITEKR